MFVRHFKSGASVLQIELKAILIEPVWQLALEMEHRERGNVKLRSAKHTLGVLH